MFEELEDINHRPEPFECCTVADLWTDDQGMSRELLKLTSRQPRMLSLSILR